MNKESNKDQTTALSIGGVFKYNHYRDGQLVDTWEEQNIVVDEGLNYTLDAAFSGASALTTWYLALFQNNYAPIAANVAATFFGAGVANEVTTQYNEATRPVWSEAGVAAKTITNSASPATFTFNAPLSVYGAALVSTSTKGGTTGKLGAASKFGSVRSMLALDVLTVTYTLTISST